MGTIFHISVRF